MLAPSFVMMLERNPTCNLCTFGADAERPPKTICLLPEIEVKDVMVVAESPSMPCDTYGRVWAGNTLTYLRDFFKKKKLDPYYTYAIKCAKPARDAKVTPKHMKACTTAFLKNEIALVRPKHIIVFGNDAMKAVCGKTGITDKRGNRWFDEKLQAYIYPTHNQNQIAYNAEIKRDFYKDLHLFCDWINGKQEAVEFNPSWYVIDTLKGLRKIQRLMRESGNPVYCDTETTGKDPFVVGFKWRTIQFCWDDKFGGVLVPLMLEPDCYWEDKENIVDPFWQNEPIEQAIEIIREILLEFPLDWQNGKYDRSGGHTVGEAYFGGPILAPRIGIDTMHVAHLFDENRKLGLKQLASQELGIPSYDIKDKVTKNLAELFPYGAKDVVAGFLVARKYRAELNKPENKQFRDLYTKVIRPMDALYTEMEIAGWPVDEVTAQAVYNGVQPQQDAAQKKLYAYLDEREIPYNNTTLSSPQQLAKIIFEVLKLPPSNNKKIAKTPTGGYSTNNDALIHVKNHEFIALLFEYRKLAKALSTYILPLLEAAKTCGIARTSYKITGTVTGRSSSGQEEG